jgi:predicted dehydrogenase
MKALVVGTDYFSDRFRYLLEKEGLYVRKAKRLPREPDCDIAFFSGALCTPANISRALREGADVFSEQLIFDNSGDISFVQYARDHGLKLYLGSFDIFNPVVRQVSDLIKGRDVLAIRLERVGPVSHSNIDIVEDSVMHGIGTLMFIIGARKPSLDIMSCFADKERSRCTLMMRMGEAEAQLTASNVNEYKERTIEIFCKTLRIRADLLRQEIHILDTRIGDPNLCDAGAWSFRRYFVRKEEPLMALVRDFLNREGNPVSYAFIWSLLQKTLEAKSRLTVPYDVIAR